MPIKIAQVAVFGLVTFLYVFSWPVPRHETGLIGIFIVDFTLAGILAAYFVWFHPRVRGWDRRLRARGVLSGILVGLATVFIAWLLHSIVMYFVLRRQIGVFNVLSQNGQKFLWRVTHERSAILMPVLYGIAGFTTKSLFAKR